MLSLFALHASNRFVHVSEVERGLACDCRCTICGEPVIARLGDVREHHFAHSSNAEPCSPNYESDLHRFAKRVILEAGGLVVPVTPSVAPILGFADAEAPRILLTCMGLEEEVAIGNWRPDLLATTTEGVSVAIEVAYSSFCGAEKRQAFADLRLPALEIDLRAFTPAHFDVQEVKRALLEEVDGKVWIWPEPAGLMITDDVQPTNPAAPPTASSPTLHQFLPEEIVTVRGRWVSIKKLPSGDITMKVIRFDPEVVAIIRSVARSHYGRYVAAYHNWVIPRHRAEAACAQIRAQGAAG